VIDPGKGPVAIGSEQIEGRPAKGRSDGAKRAIEKLADIVDELKPTLRRHAFRGSVGIEPTETLGPFPRDAAVMLYDRGAFFPGFAPPRDSVANRLPERRGCLDCIAACLRDVISARRLISAAVSPSVSGKNQACQSFQVRCLVDCLGAVSLKRRVSRCLGA
jgi:hypothetical protein